VAIIDNEYVDSDMYAIFKHVLKKIQKDEAVDQAAQSLDASFEADEDSGLIL
jgi:L-fucose isomerase-like protein